MPDADGLGGDAKLAGDFVLADADGEQLGGSEPADLEPVTLLLRRRRRGIVGMPAILTAGQPSSNSARASLNLTPKFL